MLEKGFHKSFSELFNLVQQQKVKHEQAGPAAVLLEPLINTDHAKLEYLRVQLTAAEDAERLGNLEGVYSALRSLAQYFEKNQGTWLSFHFYQRSLEVASRITGDNQRAKGEGQCSVGLAMERRGMELSIATCITIIIMFMCCSLAMYDYIQESCRRLPVILRCTKSWHVNTSGVRILETVCMRYPVNTSEGSTLAWPKR